MVSSLYSRNYGDVCCYIAILALFYLLPHIVFSMAENGPQLPPPRLGQHTKQILSNILGYTSDEIDMLRANKVIQ